MGGQEFGCAASIQHQAGPTLGNTTLLSSGRLMPDCERFNKRSATDNLGLHPTPMDFPAEVIVKQGQIAVVVSLAEVHILINCSSRARQRTGGNARPVGIMSSMWTNRASRIRGRRRAGGDFSPTWALPVGDVAQTCE